MKVIVISSPEELIDELKTVHELFEAGLRHFHLRKPKYSTNGLRSYLRKIHPKFRSRVVIHSHHELCIPYKLGGVHLTNHHLEKKFWQNWLMLKYIKIRRPDILVTAGFHTIGDLKRENPGYGYVFLSPVFNSISKLGYKSTFNEDSLMKMIAIAPYNVIALGGVDEDKITKARELGFYGVALLGSIWKTDDPVLKLTRILEQCNSNVSM